MAFQKGLDDIDHLPVSLSSHRSILTVNGGTLPTLYNMRDRHDDPYYRSRCAPKRTKKDFRINGRRDYRPWQRLIYAE
jgi:hypothetical protein